MPRVITGSARGTVLAAPDGLKTRPTSDRVKESVFSILADRIPGCRMLDLFAGTGQMGIEALSRGAVGAVFIDSGRESVACIRRNLEKTHLANRAVVLAQPVFPALGSLPAGTKFDLVYIDPPYAEAAAICREATRILVAKDLIAESALVLIEHSARDEGVDFVTHLQFLRRCKYGTVMISFYNRYSSGDEAGLDEGV